MIAEQPEELERRLEQEGYVVLEGVLGADEVARLRNFLTVAFAQHRRGDTPDSGIRTDSPLFDAMWPDFYQENPEWFSVFCNDRIVGALHGLLGGTFVLTRDSIVHSDYFSDWHTDTTTSEAAGDRTHLSPEWRMLTVGIYLQTGGGLEVVAGSHRQPDPFVALRTRHDADIRQDQWFPSTSIEIPLEAGDAVIFDMRLIHRAAPTTPRNDRGEPCQKIGVFSRVSRNIPGHIEAYSVFRFDGAGSREENLPVLREQASHFGFLLD